MNRFPVCLSLLVLALAASARSQNLVHTLTPPTPVDGFGAAVAIAGDLNGDGIAEILVGAPGSYYTSAPGQVLIYSGATGSLLHTVIGPGSGFGSALAPLGDVNGDTVPDFAVCPQGRVYSGAVRTVLYTVAQPGSSVAAIGDLNSDGVTDFAMGLPGGGSSGGGRVVVYSGATGAVLFAVDGADPAGTFGLPEQFGSSVAGIGDANGDGMRDILVGARGASVFVGEFFLFNVGRAYVLSGSNGAILASVSGQFQQESFGIAVCGVGDVNGDGRADFAVGAFEAPAAPTLENPYPPPGAGRVDVFSGSGGARLYSLYNGAEFTYHFGAALANAGDVNGDGRTDFVVGTLVGSVRAHVFSNTGVLVATLTGLGGGFEGSDAVSLAGADLNGDGCAEIVVGDAGSFYGIPGRAQVYGFGCSAPVDATPPVVVVTSPADGAVLGTAAATVTATVTDASSTDVSSTPSGITASLVAGTHVVSGTIALVEGSNAVAVTATDAFHNVGGTSLTVVRDTIPPAITILSPPAGSILGDGPASVTVQVADATATSVTFGGNTFALPTGSGTVTGPVALAGGNNTIAIAATDAAGNTATATRNVILDANAPVVTIDAPADGASFGPGSSPLPVIATIDDLTATTVNSTPAGVAGPLSAGGGIVTGAIALVEGSNTITVRAIDAAGRTGSASLSVLLDTTPPLVAIESPGDGAVIRGTIDFHASAEDVCTGTGIARVELRVDGGLVQTFAASPYETQYDTTALGDGQHTLSATAFDGKDNHATATVNVVVDNTGPLVAITNPVPLAFVAGTIPITVTAADAGSGLVSLQMLSGGSAPTTDASTTYVTPVAGDVRTGAENTTRWPDGALLLMVRAVDAAGNQSETQIQVTVDNTAPEKALLSPVDGQTVTGIITIATRTLDPNLARIDIKVDGVLLASSTTSPFSIPYDTTARIDGPMSVTAVAVDLAGNSSTSTANVTISNFASTLVLTPRTLSLKSKGEGPVAAHLEGVNLGLLLPPENHGMQLRVPGGNPVPVIAGFAQIADSDLDGIPELTVRFNRQSLITSVRAGIAANLIAVNGTVTVTLVADGTVIGTDVIRVRGD